MAAVVRMALGALFTYIGAIKFMHIWTASIPQTLALFTMTIGPQNDWTIEVFLRGLSALQILAGFLIVINQCKNGAQILFLTLVGFLATTYNPWIVGFDYKSVTLFVNEAALVGICWMLWGYSYTQLPPKCPFAHNAGEKKEEPKAEEKQKID